jgi:hypothetical protein
MLERQKVINKTQNKRKGFSYYFLRDDGRIQVHIRETQKLKDPTDRDP